jgi:thiol-disulfide isomerase/thioredoxin
MDLDGDGVLAPFPSPERATARGEPVVFRTGEKYFSIAKVDLVSRTMTVRSHQQRDYLRVELKLGAHFPNFAFIDFAGHSHTLSDIKADCLLLDFWGSWCPPCLGEFPVLKRAYQTFKPRGFDILGIDSNESSAQARECILRNDLPWLQATSESTSEFADKRLDISTYPTLILLDKKRTIISLDREGPNLRGDQLLETLNHLLPFGPQI